MDRAASVERLRTQTFDLLVIGGGVTGSGAAWDAALRRMKVALVDKGDWGSGTSSRSSKLLHGGLRYLRYAELGLVREGLVERRENLRVAPHLVRPLRFVIPRIERRHPLIGLGLFAYDVLALGSRFPRHRRLERADVGQLAPAVREDARGGLSYWDATVDDARLTWSIARSAIEAGAAAANHLEVVALVRGSSGAVTGARVRDGLDGGSFEVSAKAVINATGVWADDLRALEASDALLGVRPSKGVHLVFDRTVLPVDAALLLPTPDDRFVFVVPFEDETTLVGTTDTEYAGSLDDPVAGPDDVDYLLEIVNGVVQRPLRRDDVIATIAGLRPLVGGGGRTKDVSRRHLVSRGPGGVVTVTGGKLTAWRPMARHAVDVALRGFTERPKSRTDRERLSGAAAEEGVVPALRAVLAEFGLDQEDAERLYRRYGAHAAQVLRIVGEDPRFAARLHPDAPYMLAEAEYAIRSEMAVTVEDVIERRLRLSLTTTDHGERSRSWVFERLAVLRR